MSFEKLSQVRLSFAVTELTANLEPLHKNRGTRVEVAFKSSYAFPQGPLVPLRTVLSSRLLASHLSSSQDRQRQDGSTARGLFAVPPGVSATSIRIPFRARASREALDPTCTISHSANEEPDAEIFGAELVGGTQERWYPFGDEAKAAVSSWRGAELEIAGSASTEYLADEPSPVYTAYSNLHLYLERKRIEARQALRADAKLLSTLAGSVLDPSYIAPRTTDQSTETESDPSGTAASTVYRPEGQGPRVMVLGPESAGKTSLVKFLANYALRSPAVASLGKGEAGKSQKACVQVVMVSSTQTWKRTYRKRRRRRNGRRRRGAISRVGGRLWSTLTPSDGAPPLPCCLSALPLTPLPLASLPSPSPAFPFGTNTGTTGSIPPGTSTAHSVAPLSLWLGKRERPR